MDSQTFDQGYRVQQFTGDVLRTRDTARNTVDWVIEAQRRGAGEIVLNWLGLTSGVPFGPAWSLTDQNARPIPTASSTTGGLLTPFGRAK